MSYYDPTTIKAEHSYRSEQIRNQIVDAHRARELRRQRRRHRESLAILRWYLG
jgi:hypothetical protein